MKTQKKNIKIKPAKIDKGELLEGLDTLKKEQEPTMIVVPDAVKLGLDCYEVYKQVLAHCNHMQSRVAIFDVYDGMDDRVEGNADVDVIAKFREKIGSEYLKYGAAYYPWLETSIVSKQDLTFENFAPSVKLKDILLETDAQTIMANYNSAKAPEPKAGAKGEEGAPAGDGGKSDTEKTNFHLELLATSPTYLNLLEELRRIIISHNSVCIRFK